MAIIRSILVKIGADISGLSSDLSTAKKQFEGVGKSLDNVGKTMSASVTLPVIGAGIAIFKAGSEMEQGMSNIKALGGSTASELAALKDQAMQLGQETKFSAVEAAKGIEELMKAGLNAKQILGGGLEGALSLAAAGELELGEAAEIAATALNAFKNDNLSVAKAADIMAGAANASATDVRELKMGLSQVSAVASGVGLSFEDTVTALADFAQSGLKGSDAGTSLKTMLLRLQPATKEQVKLFGKLNLLNEKGQSIFFTSAGKLKNMSEIAGILTKSLKGYSDAQRLAMLETMFGTDAIRAANILYKDGEAGITSMKQSMSNVTAEEVAAEKMNNVRGSLENLMGSLETLAVKLYDAKAGPIKSLIDGINGLVVNFSNLSSGTQQSIVMFVGLAAAIGPVALVLSGISNGLAILAGAFAAISGVLAGVIESFALFAGGAGTLGECLALLPGGPIAWVIGALIALGAALTTLWVTNEGFRDNVTAAWNMIKSAAISVFDWIKPYIIGAFASIGDYFAKWSPIVADIFKTLDSILRPIITVLFGFIKEYVIGTLGAMFTFLSAWTPLFKSPFESLFNAIKLIVSTAIGIVKVNFETTLLMIQSILKAVSLAMKGDWSGAWNAIVSTFKIAASGLNAQAEIIRSFFTQAFTNLKTDVLNVWNSIVSGIAGTVNAITSSVNAVINAINSIPAVPDIPTIPQIQMPKVTTSNSTPVKATPKVDTRIVPHADGGIFTKPTLIGNHLFGEAGTEVLTPLDKLESMIGATGQNIIQVILDGQVIQEYTDNRLGRKLVGLGG